MIDYAGQVALVTGGASGIGRALGAALSARGARVVLADVAPGVMEAADAIGARGVVADLADGGAAARLVADAYERDGRLDLIASNAGLGYRKRLLTADLDDPGIARLFEVNMLAPFRFAQAWLPRLKAAGARGRLLVTGSENSLSVPAFVARSPLALYAASKHAVLVMLERLREEVARFDEPLDLHMLLPGGVYTGMTAPQLSPNPEEWPAEAAIISAERCAELALRGMDLSRFHIPTHAHLLDDMRPRLESVAETLRLLGLRG